jgi:hypothetical protein
VVEKRTKDPVVVNIHVAARADKLVVVADTLAAVIDIVEEESTAVAVVVEYPNMAAVEPQRGQVPSCTTQVALVDIVELPMRTDCPQFHHRLGAPETVVEEQLRNYFDCTE